MNNGGYASHDPEKLGPKIEELVKADLGLEAPIPYEMLVTGDNKVSAGSLIADAAKHFFGGKEAVVLMVRFDLQQPRPLELQVALNRQGVGAHIGTVLYASKLSKPVTGEVSLEEPKTFSSSKFVGDAALAAKLNASKDLIKRVGKFARTEWDAFKIKAPRCFQIKQENGVPTIIASTFPRSYAMGFKVSLDVKEFAELANLIESLV